jgi:predicted ATPase
MPNPKIVDKIKQSVRMSVPLTVTTYKLPHETEEQIDEILAAYLEELGQGQLKDHLSYCLKELAVNAKKANTKRVYFDEKKLDLQSREDYVEGMKNFKEETLNNHDFWLEMQKNRGLYIKFLFHPKGREFQDFHQEQCGNHPQGTDAGL